MWAIFHSYGNLTLLWKVVIEFVDLPSYKRVIFHSKLLVYQGVTSFGGTTRECVRLSKCKITFCYRNTIGTDNVTWDSPKIWTSY